MDSMADSQGGWLINFELSTLVVLGLIGVVVHAMSRLWWGRTRCEADRALPGRVSVVRSGREELPYPAGKVRERNLSSIPRWRP